VPRDQWCSPTGLEMHQISLVSSQALLVKIVTEILFGQCILAKAIKQPSWQQITDQRTMKRQRPRDMYAQERTNPQGQKVGTGVAPWRPWRVRHCRSRIIQAITWTTLCKHHWKYFVRGGLRRTTTFKQQENNVVGRSTLPESWETLTHQSHMFSQERK